MGRALRIVPNGLYARVSRLDWEGDTGRWFFVARLLQVLDWKTQLVRIGQLRWRIHDVICKRTQNRHIADLCRSGEWSRSGRKDLKRHAPKSARPVNSALLALVVDRETALWVRWLLLLAWWRGHYNCLTVRVIARRLGCGHDAACMFADWLRGALDRGITRACIRRAVFRSRAAWTWRRQSQRAPQCQVCGNAEGCCACDQEIRTLRGRSADVPALRDLDLNPDRDQTSMPPDGTDAVGRPRHGPPERDTTGSRCRHEARSDNAGGRRHGHDCADCRDITGSAVRQFPGRDRRAPSDGRGTANPVPIGNVIAGMFGARKPLPPSECPENPPDPARLEELSGYDFREQLRRTLPADAMRDPRWKKFFFRP